MTRRYTEVTLFIKPTKYEAILREMRKKGFGEKEAPSFLLTLVNLGLNSIKKEAKTS